MKLGLSGRLTRFTITSPLTPLFLLAAIAVGLLALFSIPREEEPQISVPMVDIQVAAPGLAAPDAVELIGIPLVLQCAGGKRSGMALERCAKAQAAIDTHLAGGLGAWKSAGLPVERG